MGYGRELASLVGVDDLRHPEACKRMLDDLAGVAGLQRDCVSENLARNTKGPAHGN